ncbi:MAG: penicillin-binding transpeptidase domain-containing protein [Oligoflexia bacterium]|nr:penicillin-binding transpeptidase domain-containing protein [Oligoflexia bacterium]
MFKGQIISQRIFFVVFVFAVLWSVLLIRSAWLQLIPNSKLSRLQDKLFERTVTLKPRRGNIYDRHNKELAISIPSQSLFADPKRMKEPYYSAKKLAQLFCKPKSFFLKKFLNKNKRFVWVKRHLSKRELKQIKSWNLKGLYFLKESKRFYTHENSLSQVLGFTGVEGQGLEGIERQYEDILKGESQKVLIQRDARGRPLFRDFSPFISKVSGYDAHLTIDSDLQFYLEKGLKQAIEKSQAESAIGLILSAETSEVLAMANLPNYSSNQALKAPAWIRRNRAITDIFEPGSTLKTFTVISALKSGISPTQVYSSQDGRLEIGSAVITEADSKKKFRAFLNLSDILAFSSNVGAGSIALGIGDKKLRKTFKIFGFGKKTGIDFPGEAKGLLRELPWREIETATISFGHGIASTALQVANAYTAIANGGWLKQPVLVKKIRNPYTGEEKALKAKNLKRVLTEEEARTLSLMLISVTEEHGTGVLANVPGYFVAGKTGTAQKVNLQNRGYKKGEYISSFAGFIPAHNPKFVIYLMIDGAKDNFYASSLVAPLFSRVASYAVRQAGLLPTVLEEENIVLTSAGDRSGNSQKESIKTKWLLEKERNSNIKSDSFISRSITNIENQGLTKHNPFFIHDLKGLSLRQILKQLDNKDLRVKIQGSGRLLKSIPQGDKNEHIILIFG